MRVIVISAQFVHLKAPRIQTSTTNHIFKSASQVAVAYVCGQQNSNQKLSVSQKDNALPKVELAKAAKSGS